MQADPMTYDDILALGSPAPGLRMHYGHAPLQFGELRVPDGKGSRPIAVVVHGGCWRARYDLTHIGSFSDSLTSEGLATWTLEYRRVGHEGGGWPGTLLDVAAGVDYLREIAKDYPIDLERVVAVGHSAGGQLVLWLATRQGLPESSPLFTSSPLPLAGVVSLAGVDDLARAVREEVCGDMAAELLGGAPTEVPERYREASPIERLPLGVALHLVSGSRDDIVPPAFAEDFQTAAGRAGDSVTWTVIEGAGHFDLIAPTSSAWPKVRQAIVSLVER
jgi:acetyl esterase/lipase